MEERSEVVKRVWQLIYDAFKHHDICPDFREFTERNVEAAVFAYGSQLFRRVASRGLRVFPALAIEVMYDDERQIVFVEPCPIEDIDEFCAAIDVKPVDEGPFLKYVELLGSGEYARATLELEDMQLRANSGSNNGSILSRVQVAAIELENRGSIRLAWYYEDAPFSFAVFMEPSGGWRWVTQGLFVVKSGALSAYVYNSPLSALAGLCEHLTAKLPSMIDQQDMIQLLGIELSMESVRREQEGGKV